MAKLAGMIHERKIYDDAPNLAQLQCNPNYYAIPSVFYSGATETRCDYCGRKVSGDECESCGAPSK